MKEPLYISVIIAVYERKEELTELLESLSKQTDKNFEVLVVDDGSPCPLDELAAAFKAKLNIHYHYKANSGPGKSRNYGMERALGNYFVFLDSDTIAKENHIEHIYKNLSEKYVDAFGGGDEADDSFTVLQKAITFSMTSLLTTGGIRGAKNHIGKFQPRSFNMGLSKQAFFETEGFSELKIGEDPDLSMTLWGKGFRTRLFTDINVAHKRRTSLNKFAKQVYGFGIARPILNQRHPQFTKLTFWFPSLFLLGMIFSFFLFVISFFAESKFILRLPSLFVLLYFILLCISSSFRFNSFKVGVFSILTTFIQFSCYGFGFLKAQIVLNLFRIKAADYFHKHFLIRGSIKI